LAVVYNSPQVDSNCLQQSTGRLDVVTRQAESIVNTNLTTTCTTDHRDTWWLTSRSVNRTLQRVSTQVRPRLVTLAALARRPRTYPLQTRSHSALLSAVQGSSPEYLVDRLLYTSLRHSQPTSFTVSDSTSPRYWLSTFGCRAFSVVGPTVWNSLPDSLRDPALSSNSYTQSLKTNLFRHYHSTHTAQ